MTHPFRVLVLCTGNSARSQMAEALLAHRGAGRVRAASAGSQPAPWVNPLAVEILKNEGIDWSGRVPHSIADVERSGERFDLVITVCDHARDACPFFPGAAAQVHWGLPDPATSPPGEPAYAAFGAVYDALARRIDALLALPLEQLPPPDVASRAAAIHERAVAADTFSPD